ncbi:DUF4262 domain-containing protein [Verrucomicrobium sp. BvORR034]|uniref:DUF4262 domain-containing protein n=1 Tax=Verrucomicrobium sp. BvORR034 TaxID=1396418 RepID=UPI000678E113|nr:DUF4262 domain-containing protein [Verrucomicrobium sp. BvORR034]
MPDFPALLPEFRFRLPDDAGDEKLLGDVQEYGWHVVAIPDDAEGPGFAFTVGLYLRTLQPEILIMGIPMEPAHRILNAVGRRLVTGGTLVPDERYHGLVDGRDVCFRPIHKSWFHEYLGYANWFYRPSEVKFPAFQCFWPDSEGRFPWESGFDARFADRQIDLSLPDPDPLRGRQKT